MGHQGWLAEACRVYGLSPVEVEGWQVRGSAAFNPKGVVCHHTAGAAQGEIPSLRVLVGGRPGLPGPLCNVGLARSGAVYVIAAGRANHAGRGGFKGLQGNSSVFGIEAESTGDGRDWTAEQRHVYPVLARMLADGCGVSVANICGHREWAPDRKIDPAGIDMNQLRDEASRVGNRPCRLTDNVEAPHHETVREGDRSFWVAHCQDGLRCKGKLAGPLDGIFGHMTAAALRAFQQENGLQVDAVCGPVTWQRLHT